MQDLPAVPEISKTEDDFEVSMVDIVCIVFVFHTQNIKNYKDCFIFGMGNIYCASHMQECNNATAHALSPTFDKQSLQSVSSIVFEAVMCVSQELQRLMLCNT